MDAYFEKFSYGVKADLMELGSVYTSQTTDVNVHSLMKLELCTVLSNLRLLDIGCLLGDVGLSSPVIHAKLDIKDQGKTSGSFLKVSSYFIRFITMYSPNMRVHVVELA